MSSTGAVVFTSLGQLNGVHRFRHNPRGTLNSSNSLFVDLTTSIAPYALRWSSIHLG